MCLYKISVVVPCYNVSKYIDRCMECLNEQTFKDFEIICINDGSTDNTLEILNKYKRKGVKIISTTNQGVSQARNEGIEAACGEYIYFFDPDDYLCPNALSILFEKVKATNCDCVQFGFKVVGENGQEVNGKNGNKEAGVYDRKKIFEVIFPRYIGYSVSDIKKYGTKDFYANYEMCSVWRFLYKSSVIKKYKIRFPKQIHLGEDTMFNCMYFYYADAICVINDILYTYYSKNSGGLLSSLKKTETLIQNKIACVFERNLIRGLFQEKYNVDIFPMYAGSLFLSAVELSVKCSCSTKLMSGFINYVHLDDVQSAIDMIPLEGGHKVRILLWLFKKRLFKLTYFLMFIANKLGIKFY